MINPDPHRDISVNPDINQTVNTVKKMVAIRKRKWNFENQKQSETFFFNFGRILILSTAKQIHQFVTFVYIYYKDVCLFQLR